jgi:hypothetical protein
VPSFHTLQEMIEWCETRAQKAWQILHNCVYICNLIEMASRTFEDEVAALYQLMGHEVRSETHLSAGGGPDLLVTYRTPGLSAGTFAVECKYREKGNVSAKDIRETYSRFTHVLHTGRVAALVVVTNTGFSADARHVAEQTGIRCLTFSEVMNDALNVADYLGHLIREYAHDEHGPAYIDLRVHEINAASPKAAVADEYLMHWLGREDSNLLILLGGAGSGKTTFCQKVAGDMARQYLADPKSGRIPVLVRARELGPELPLRDAILRVIQAGSIVASAQRTIGLLNERGMLFLMVDGLDEVVRQGWRRTLDESIRLVSSPRSKVLMTTRPHDYETGTLLDRLRSTSSYTQVIAIDALNPSDIRRYLASEPSLGDRQRSILSDHVMASRQLMDLAKCPLFLRLMIEWTQQGFFQEGASISKLYEAFIATSLEHARSEACETTPSEGMQMMTDIAMHMYRSNQDSVSQTDLDLSLVSSSSRQIQTLPFLTRDRLGAYRFVHESVRDFLVARKLARDIEAHDASGLSESLLRGEILSFLAGFDLPLDDLREWTSALAPRVASADVLAENVQRLLQLRKGATSEQIPSIRLCSLQLSQIKCFTNVVLNFRTDKNAASVTLLVGDNGVGKSTILQGIALCALGPDLAARLVSRPDSYLRDGAPKGFIRATFTAAGLGREDETEIVICLAVSRRLVRHPAPQGIAIRRRHCHRGRPRTLSVSPAGPVPSLG